MMRAPKFAALAATLAHGFRTSRKTVSKSKTLAGKPIHNYELRHLQGPQIEGPDAEYDWVLMFKGIDDQRMEEFCSGAGCKAAGHPNKGVPFATVRGSEAYLEGLLRATPEIDFAEPDLPVFEIPEVEDRPADAANVDHWGLDRINLERATYTGKGVHIYVMDTGVRTTHEEFGGRAIPTVDTIAGGGEALECDPSDVTCAADEQSGHGTHVAGTTGGTKYGVAPDATIHAMKVCCGFGTNTFAGMDYIATKAEHPAVMTMSLGSYGNSMAAKTALDTVVNAGVTVFVSSGNNNIDACGKTYAFIESAIVVGAANRTDTRASWSNYGTCNDIFAPGVAIPSASNRTDTGLRTLSGTSMATPMVAGVGALLLEEDPTLSPAGLREKMLGMTEKNALTDLKTGDPNLLLQAA